jgi:hypothetical protein
MNKLTVKPSDSNVHKEAQIFVVVFLSQSDLFTCSQYVLL